MKAFMLDRYGKKQALQQPQDHGRLGRGKPAAFEDRPDRPLLVHHPDGLTPMEVIVRGLDDLAGAGKIVAGLSNFPARRLARATTPAAA